MNELDQIEISFEAQRFFIYTLQSTYPRNIRAFDCYGTYVITPDFHPRRYHGDGYAQVVQLKSADSRNGGRLVSITLFKASTGVASNGAHTMKPDWQVWRPLH